MKTSLRWLSVALVLTGLTACGNTGRSGKAWFGPGSGAQTSGGATGGGGAPADDHGNDIQSATFMAGNPAGGPANGSGGIDYAGDVDFFQIYIDTTGVNTITFSTSSSGDTFLALLDANGNQIAANDDEDPNQNPPLLNSKIVLQAPNVPPTGFYFLAVGEGQNAQGTLPTYGVHVQF
ncbi:MAG: hypothetical protein D6731_06245 [Planctomycetota bacterium]|nr:MAG: hypothetical protein D6731_06245 [Planctomycetota bacterium]